MAPCSRLFVSLLMKRMERGIEICFKRSKLPALSYVLTQQAGSSKEDGEAVPGPV